MTSQGVEIFSQPFIEQFEFLYSETKLQLVGSIGRGAIMSSYGIVDAMPPVLRASGEYRDIDVLDHTNSSDIFPASATEPLDIDLECNKWVKNEQDGVWLTFPGDSSIAEEVRPEVFEPVVRMLGNSAYRTYSVDTQQRINRLVAFERPKDKKSFKKYDDFVASLDNLPATHAGDARLPNEFYEPFDNFRQAIREKHPGYIWACRAGVLVNELPHPLRDASKKIGTPLRRHYLS